MIVKPSSSNILKAAKILKRGGVVAVPTETFYALCVNALNKNSVKKIIQIKGRSSQKGIPVVFKSVRQLNLHVKKPGKLTLKLMEEFWPGPLNLIFINKKMPKIIEGNKKSILARNSSGKVINKLMHHISFPLTATSANISGGSNPRSASGVKRNIGKFVDLIVDGGRLNALKPSTIADSRMNKLKILREGKIPSKNLYKHISF